VCVHYLLWSEKYAAAFEMNGGIGDAMMRSLGVLFIMLNGLYVVAVWNPDRYRIALYIAISMQAIGVVGESWMGAIWRI